MYSARGLSHPHLQPYSRTSGKGCVLKAFAMCSGCGFCVPNHVPGLCHRKAPSYCVGAATQDAQLHVPAHETALYFQSLSGHAVAHALAGPLLLSGEIGNPTAAGGSHVDRETPPWLAQHRGAHAPISACAGQGHHLHSGHLSSAALKEEYFIMLPQVQACCYFCIKPAPPSYQLAPKLINRL